MLQSNIILQVELMNKKSFLFKKNEIWHIKQKQKLQDLIYCWIMAGKEIDQKLEWVVLQFVPSADTILLKC